jgi:hypothetical protein
MKKLINYVRSKLLHIWELLPHAALFGFLKQGTHLLYNTINLEGHKICNSHNASSFHSPAHCRKLCVSEPITYNFLLYGLLWNHLISVMPPLYDYYTLH